MKEWMMGFFELEEEDVSKEEIRHALISFVTVLIASIILTNVWVWV